MTSYRCFMAAFSQLKTIHAVPRQTRFALAPVETPVRGQESSAGGLREVAHGEDAFWAMNAGRDAVTSTKQEGFFWPGDLYGAAHRAIFLMILP